MSGIYIHIPFCKQACFYCDFHFSTNLQFKDSMVAAICQEIIQRGSYLSDKVQTIYFGGGTPSLLTILQVEKILDTIFRQFIIDQHVEITLECNPDDLSVEKLEELKNAGINRLSIGVQTFNDSYLKFMNRAHNANQSVESIKIARAAGFDNLTIDLIYGVPASSHELWQHDLEVIRVLKPEHLSAYCLTIEDKTVFGNWLKYGKFKEADEEFQIEQFEIMTSFLEQLGYEHYEVSNFCLPGKYSRHNSSYWTGRHYLGVGPSAHSFNGSSRRKNVSNNAKYLKAICEGLSYSETERLSTTQKINEFLLTRLRTMWGCDLKELKMKFQFDLLKEKQRAVDEMLSLGLINRQGNVLLLTKKGILLADSIIEKLMLDDSPP